MTTYNATFGATRHSVESVPDQDYLKPEATIENYENVIEQIIDSLCPDITRQWLFMMGTQAAQAVFNRAFHVQSIINANWRLSQKFASRGLN